MADTHLEPRQLQARLGELGQRFLERSAKDMATSRELIEQLSQQPAALETIVQLVHKMHGAGLTLGFPEISTHADALERFASQLTRKQAITPQDIASLRELALSAERAVQRASDHR